MSNKKIKLAQRLVRSIVKEKYVPNDKERRLVINYLKNMNVNPDLVLRTCEGCSCHGDS